MQQQASDRIWTKSFISLSLIQLFIFIVFYALLTTLPLYVIHDLGGSNASAGLVVTVMLVAAIVIRPFSAKLLDIFGKKKMLIGVLLLYAGTTVLYLFIEQLVPLLLVRFLHGISFGIITTTTGAIAASIIPESRKGAGMGYFAMAMNLAMVFGPFLGLLLVQRASFQTLFYVLSAFMLISVIASFLIQLEGEKRPAVDLRIRLHDLIEVRAIPAGIISGLIGFSYASILSFVPVYAEQLGIGHISSYFFLMFAAVMLLSRPALGRAFDMKGPKKVLVPSLFVFGVGLWALGLTGSGWLFLVAAALIGLGYGTLLPGFQTISIQSTTPERSSHAISTFFIFYDLGIASGAYVWGQTVASAGFPTMYMGAGTLMFLTIGVFYRYMHRHANELL